MRPLIALLLVAFAPHIANAADPWNGKEVYFKIEAMGKVGNTKVDIDKVPMPATIKAVNGTWLWVGEAWVTQNDVVLPNGALEYYTDVVRRNPRNAVAWLRRGAVWAENHEFNKALSDYTEGIRLNPKDAIAYYNRGNVWKRKQDFHNALNDYTEAIRLCPAYASAFHNRGIVWRVEGNFDNAIKDLAESIQLYQEQASDFNNRGLAYRLQGDLDKAINDYLYARLLDPRGVVACYNRGKAWESKREFDKAIKDYTEAIRLNPTLLVAHYRRAMCWRMKGDLDNFLKDCKDATRIQPKDATGYGLIAWVRATCPNQGYRDGKEAVEYATKACELTKWRLWFALGTLAAGYAEDGDFTNAVAWQQKVVEMAPPSRKQSAKDRLDLYRAQKPYREAPNENAAGLFDFASMRRLDHPH